MAVFGGDTLNGGAGPDYLYGGPGIDTASYEDSPDGVDIDLAKGTGQGGDAEGDIIDGIENVLGSLHNDNVIGNDDANRLEGLDGRDLLIGNGGADYLYGNLGGDILDGGRGADHLFGGRGDDMLRGGAGGDHLDGGPDVDTVWYGLSVLGVQLNLEAGLGFAGEALGDVFVSIENVFGSLRDDIIVGSIEANVIEGATGSDYIVGDAGDDHLFGGYAPATIAAGDAVFPPGDAPSDGDDTLVGGPGNDTLNGGTGADKLTGGRDADTFVWRDIHESGLTAETMDLIKDFNFSEGDKIGLHAIDAVEATTDINEDFTFIGTADFSTAGQIRYYQDGTDTFIALNTNGDLEADAVIRIAGLRTPDALWFNP
jgi:Ca2+-binding RTX toxin-like protein